MSASPLARRDFISDAPGKSGQSDLGGGSRLLLPAAIVLLFAEAMVRKEQQDIVRAQQAADNAQATADAAKVTAEAIDVTPYISEDGSNPMAADLAMGSNKITGLSDGGDTNDAVNKGQLDAHTGDATKHFTEASIDHGAIGGLTDDDHTQYLKADGARSATGKITIVTAEPTLSLADSTSDATTKIGSIVVPSATNSEEDVCALRLRNTTGVSKLYLGGSGSSSENTCTAIGFYIASSVHTAGASSTEVCRFKNGTARIGGTGGNPASCAQLEVKSTTGGLLLPRMTTVQKSAISSPAAGLMVWDTTLSAVSVYNGTDWDSL